ncbi:MAG: hypothetical protein O7E52_21095 [Candidatus Poribacteria bacterium]|nr:hypothetical protein [Candidatus Poribacteria bacterium]
MFTRSLTLTLSLLVMTLALNTLASAQIEQVTLQMDSFCGNECFRHVKKIITFYEKHQSQHPYHVRHVDGMDVLIDRKHQKVVLFPAATARVDLYDLRQELRNARRGAQRGRGTQPNLQKIEVVVRGSVANYIKTYSGGVLHPQVVLRVEGTDQRFLLRRGKQLDALLALVAADNEPVRISGKVLAFQEKYLPVLKIYGFEAVQTGAQIGKAAVKSNGHTLSRVQASRLKTATKDG